MPFDELDLSVSSAQKNEIWDNKYYRRVNETRPGIYVYQTHIEVSPYKKGSHFDVEKTLSTWLFKIRRYKPFAYKVLNNVLYVPKGTNIELLENSFQTPHTLVKEYDKIKSFVSEPHMLYGPKDDIQKFSIDFLTSSGKFERYGGNSQYALTLRTGYGKTFCTIAAIVQKKQRSVIFTSRATIEYQWVEEFKKFTDIPEKRILVVDSLTLLDTIRSGEDDHDIYIMSHQVLTMYAKKNGWLSIKELFANSGIGIKVFDEAHLYLENLCSIDFFSNTKLTYYLSGTLERSDQRENSISKTIFSLAYKFGEKITSNLNKHIVYIPILYNSHASDLTNALMHKNGYFSSYSYIEYGLYHDDCINLEIALRYAITDIIDCTQGQTLIVSPKIESVEKIADIITTQLGGRSDLVKKIYSKNTKDENIEARDAKFISSTIKSSGIGFSPDNLQTIICIDPISSSVLFKQLLGRLDRYKPGEPTYFYDLIDTSLYDISKYYDETHLPVMKTYAKEIRPIRL